MTDKKAIVLLIHGYQGTTFEMEPFVRPLESLGLTTRLITLPGHDSSLEEFRKTGYPHWLACVQHEYDRAALEYEKVLLVGYSLGGSLALDVASRRAPTAVITMASPVFNRKGLPRRGRDLMLFLLPVLRFFIKETRTRPGRPESRAIAPWRGYEGVAYPPQVYSLFKGVDNMRARLAHVTAPLLIIHDARDRLVSAENALRMAAGVSSELVELGITRARENVTSHHTITTHRETGRKVVELVCDFAARICGLPRP